MKRESTGINPVSIDKCLVSMRMTQVRGTVLNDAGFGEATFTSLYCLTGRSEKDQADTAGNLDRRLFKEPGQEPDF